MANSLSTPQPEPICKDWKSFLFVCLFLFCLQAFKEIIKTLGDHQADRTQISVATHDKEYKLYKNSLEIH